MPFEATWIDLEIITLSEVSQTEEDRYHMILLICGIKKNMQWNLFTKQKQTQRHGTQTMVTEDKGWGRDKLGVSHRIKTCAHYYI